MSSTTRAKRIRRIERRAAPQLLEAMRTDAISVRTADTLLYLPPDQQASELERRLSAKANLERRSHLVTQTIRQHIAGGRIDLGAAALDSCSAGSLIIGP